MFLILLLQPLSYKNLMVTIFDANPYLSEGSRQASNPNLLIVLFLNSLSFSSTRLPACLTVLPRGCKALSHLE